MEDTLVLFPLAAMGHIIPMVELAKRLLHHGVPIRILLLRLTFLNNGPIDAYISGVKASHPSISFHQLPIITPPPSLSSDPIANMLEILYLSISDLHRHLRSSSSSIRALILDFLSGPVFDVAAELQLPTYVFCPVNASALSALLYMPTLHSQSNVNLKDLGNAPLHFPGLPYPMPASYMPTFLLDRADKAGEVMVASFVRELAIAKGFIVNSFEALEARELRALAEGVSIPGCKMAPVYGIGPITSRAVTREPRHESLAWLDGQPRGSVVILSFGSMGVFSEAQLREMAVGLERSGQRFLWVVRGPPPPPGGVKSWAEPDLQALMPEGFEERTRERGFLVRSWAPQVELLEHEAVGGFVTHCGWNSVLEAVVAGVAMIAWPLYAEQQMNKVFLVEGAGVAVDMRGDESGFVGAGEVEGRVRWLMETEGGRELKRRVAAVGKEARDALRDGGASHAAMAEMLRALRGDEDGAREACNGNGRA